VDKHIMLKFILPFAALGGLLATYPANATTINFSTALPAGHQGQSVTIGGVIASGWDVSKTNNAVWINDGVILNNRQEGPTELGLGVCLASNCPTTGNGNINEIDNNGYTFEVIRLDFGATTFVNSIGLSSLDGGLKDGFAIFGSNTAQPTLSSLTAIAQGTNTSVGSITPNITINQSDRYFFVTSLKRGVNDSGSDFLLASVTTAPEPYTSAMLGLGLLAIGATLRLKTARQRNDDSK
jgi:hypothetical protein